MEQPTEAMRWVEGDEPDLGEAEGQNTQQTRLKVTGVRQTQGCSGPTSSDPSNPGRSTEPSLEFRLVWFVCFVLFRSVLF